MEEVWKDIPGFEGAYQVSNLGKVRALHYHRGTNVVILSHSVSKYGYSHCSLCKNAKVFYYSIHRLVAQAFLPNPDNLPCVNHKDCNPSNNAVWNLEWCTQQYNVNYGNALLKMISSRKGKTAPKPISAIDSSGKKIYFKSGCEAARKLNINLSNIYRALKRNTKYKGYYWKYIE